MSKIFFSSLLVMSAGIVCVSLGRPALAEDVGSANSATTNDSFMARVGGVVTGTVVGTPVCVFRKSIDEEKYGIDGMVGHTNSKMKKIAAGAIWLPFSIITGFVESPVCAAVNSLRANDKPFSISQFAISDVPKTKSAE